MSKKSPIFSQHQRPLSFGHRGVPIEHQENTLSGFRRAVELGLDGVELDVILTRDKKLVVFHDMDPERLTGVKGNVPDMTWDQLKDLEIRQSIDVGTDVIDYGKIEKIVLLEEVLEEMRGKLIVDIEIKAYSLDYKQRYTGTELARLIRRMDVFKDVFVTSFNFFPLRWLEWECSGIESGFTYAPKFMKPGGILHSIMESSWAGKLVGSTLTNMSINMIDEDTIEKIHARDLAVGAWTLFSQDPSWFGEAYTEEQEFDFIRQSAARGIDYYITDNPVKLQSFLEKL
jgi:glycerophosphoryl diester phosphodiesterase